MTCAERSELWLAYAADALDPEERRDLEAHLETGCPRCLGACAEAQSVGAHLALSLTPVAPSASVRRRLLARVGGREGPEHGVSPPSPSRGPGWLPAVASAAIATALTAAVLWGVARAPAPVATPEGELEELQALLEEQDAELAALESSLETARDALELLRSPNRVGLAMQAVEPGSRTSAQVFWDWEEYSCYFHARYLKPARAGHAYTLWLFTDRGERIRAESFDSDARREASFFTRLPKEMGKVLRTVVTEEPLPVGDSPAGEERLRSVGTVEPPEPT